MINRRILKDVSCKRSAAVGFGKERII